MSGGGGQGQGLVRITEAGSWESIQGACFRAFRIATHQRFHLTRGYCVSSSRELPWLTVDLDFIALPPSHYYSMLAISSFLVLVS